MIASASSNQRSDSSRKLDERKRLGQIVIGSQVERRRFLFMRVDRREDQYSRLRERPTKERNQARTVFAPEHPVHHDDLRLNHSALDGVLGLLVVACARHPIAFARKRGLEKLHHFAFVFDDQEVCHPGPIVNREKAKVMKILFSRHS